jgi:hypothetical protein
MQIFVLDLRGISLVASKSINAIWAGVGLGCICFFLSTLIVDDLYSQHAIAVAIMTPFMIYMRLTYPGLNTRLGKIIQWDPAIVSAYGTAAFGGSKTYRAGISFGIGCTLGSVSAFLVVLIARFIIQSLREPRMLRNYLEDFRKTHSVWFEAMIYCMREPLSDNETEILRRQHNAAESFRKLQSIISRLRNDPYHVPIDPLGFAQLNNCVSQLHVSLISLRGALNKDRVPNLSAITAVDKVHSLWMASIVALRSPHDKSHNTILELGDLEQLIGENLENHSSDDSQETFIVSCICSIANQVSSFNEAVNRATVADRFFMPWRKTAPRQFYNHIVET